MRFVIACGGTGGHLHPGMATGRVLLDAGHEVCLWLAGKSIEQTIRATWQGPVETLATAWQPARSPWAAVRLPATLLAGLGQALIRLRGTRRPDLLLAMGSRASVLPVIAARLRGIPVVLHESNAIPGKAVQWLSRSFRVTVALGFAETAARLPGRLTRHVGFPLRDLTPTGPLPGLPPGPGPVFLVMGGSQSSSAVNSLARDALIRLHRAGRTLRVIHLAGPQEQEIRDAYRAAGVPATVFGYLHDMGAAYTAATAAIARAGAGSCAELAAFGVPALYIPYPLAGDHQRYNARAMEKAGAAITRLQSTLTVDGLADRIGQWIEDPASLARMREAARQAAMPKVAEHLAALLIETARAGRRS